MSRLLASTELLVTADDRMFGLCDDGPDGPFSAPTPADGSGWLGVGTYEVTVGTVQDGVRVQLRLEAWDGEPPDDGDETVSVSFPSGLICVNEITGGIRRDVFTLPAPGDYHVQLSTDGQESYTARFWPLR